MERKFSSPKLDCVSNPEEKEVSDEDDDDRNHKHRRRESRSQSSERDSMDLAFTRPYRKPSKPFGKNGHSLTYKFDKRRGLTTGHFDSNQRIRSNNSGPGRGKGRDNSYWSQRDINYWNQSNVSNAKSSSWSAFGIVPGIPTGGLDPLLPVGLGLQGALRPPINASLSMGIARQRCRDFEERGFCLRGDMCPMEHGVNRIVVEDVQSLSQFNLPVTVPSAQLLTTAAGPGPQHSAVPSSMTLINGKGIPSKSSKPGINDDVLGLNGAYTSSTSAPGADLYDPDQPLWNNSGPEASAVLAGLHSPKTDETEPLLNDKISDFQHGKSYDSADNEFSIRSTGSVRGRIGGSRSRINMKEKLDVTPSEYLGNKTNTSPNFQGTSCQVKQRSVGDDGSKAIDSSSKPQNVGLPNSEKPTQKALRTLFVYGVPQKNNRREALLSHFRKFGEVIDLYIPLYGERAFVQFSRREEAEAALKAPDAVMGNRFIRLSWANRDCIPDDAVSSGVPITPHAPSGSAIPGQTPVANKGKDNLPAIALKKNVVHGADVPSLNSPKPVSTNGPKAPPPLQKKLETLEQMKEALRKKQEMVEQKRNDLRLRLDKLEKQSGIKGDLLNEPPAKKQKVGIAADLAKASISRSFESSVSAAIPSAIGMTDKKKSTENFVPHCPKPNTTVALQESMSSKLQSYPSVPVGLQFPMNRYKLDNRPTAFRVIPPLPSGFADVDVLKDHFLQFGDLSAAKLEEVEIDDENDDMKSEALNKCSALITYSTRHSAERAFINGKCWQGNNLQFSWLTASKSSNGPSSKETCSTLKGPLEADAQTEENLLCSVSPKVVTSGNGESGNSVRKVVVENMELPEFSQHTSSSMSSERESDKGDTC